jgi:hypothetical protein
MHIRILAHEFRQSRQQQMPSECRGNVDSQAPLGAKARARDQFIRRCHVGKDALTAGEVLLAFRRQAYLARRAVEELAAKSAFQLPQQLRHRGARQAQIVGGARETAEFSDFHECAHREQLIEASRGRLGGHFFVLLMETICFELDGISEQ